MTDVVLEPLAPTEPPPPPPPSPPRAASRALQIGALAAVLAVLTTFAFELDRFFVPKELVLHLTALIASLSAVGALRRRARSAVDRLLLTFLLLSGVSTLFATNHWLALRALTLSCSSVLLFFLATALREGGLQRRVVNGLASAVVLVAITSLLQTYGVEIDLFSVNRAPGGTLGNRNFVAHICAFGAPLVSLAALLASRKRTLLLAALGHGAITAALVLTRSRAAWLAFGTMAVVFLIAVLSSRMTRSNWTVWRRMLLIGVVSALFVGAALLLPNSLNWRSRNPYLETAQKVTNYESGSGKGRLIQYERSLLLALRNPIFGVGPGNWSVEYPARVPDSDPSLDTNEGGMTSNPWPSSDWIAMITERGLVATILLAFALLRLALANFGALRRSDNVDDATGSAALLALMSGAIVAGTFDAVLLLALPSILFWSALGALSPQPFPANEQKTSGVALIALLIGALVGVGRSAAQAVSMQIYADSSSRAELSRAAAIDPGNYKLRLRLARSGKRSERCEHARAAHELFPTATAARAAARGCQ